MPQPSHAKSGGKPATRSRAGRASRNRTAGRSPAAATAVAVAAPVMTSATPRKVRRPLPAYLLPVRLWQVVVWQIAVLAALATWRPFDARTITALSVGGVAVLATSVRVRGRCGCEWLATAVTFRRRGDVDAADPPGDPLETVLPALQIRNHTDRAGNSVGIAGVGDGWSLQRLQHGVVQSAQDARALGFASGPHAHRHRQPGAESQHDEGEQRRTHGEAQPEGSGRGVGQRMRHPGGIVQPVEPQHERLHRDVDGDGNQAGQPAPGQRPEDDCRDQVGAGHRGREREQLRRDGRGYAEVGRDRQHKTPAQQPRLQPLARRGAAQRSASRSATDNPAMTPTSGSNGVAP